MTSADAQQVARPVRELVRQAESALAALQKAEAFTVHFQILIMVTIVDLLGNLSGGASTSANAVSFVREYLGKRNPKYREIGGLLYHMLRHGVVHEQKWKSIKLHDGLELAIRGGRGSLRRHLEIERGGAGTPWENTLWLNVDDRQLWNDIKGGALEFLGELPLDKQKLEICTRALDRLIEAESVSVVANRKYVDKRDFTFLQRTKT